MTFMQRNAVDGTVLYQSELIGAFGRVVQAVTTRHGGVSPVPFDSLNLSAHVGDDPGRVSENLRRLHAALALDGEATVDASQAQAERVARVTRDQRGSRIPGVDGLITDDAGIALMLRFADCVPILLYDPAHHAIGIAHAGWRGTVGQVVTHTVTALGGAFGTRPSDLIACIGPSIGPCCYNIGPDVERRVREAFPGVESLLQARGGAVFLDLWEANALQLRMLGVAQVEISGVCTADHTDDFYSWRAEHAHTGRFGALICLQ